MKCPTLSIFYLFGIHSAGADRGIRGLFRQHRPDNPIVGGLGLESQHLRVLR